MPEQYRKEEERQGGREGVGKETGGVGRGKEMRREKGRREEGVEEGYGVGFPTSHYETRLHH